MEHGTKHPRATFHVELYQNLLSALIELGEKRAAALAPRLLRLAERTSDWSERMNLTGLRGAKAITRELILDPFAWAPLLPEEPSLIADLGSGAGFPGFPLSLHLPHSRVVMIEGRKRRHYFQRTVRRELSLSNVELIWGRVESVPATPCQLVVAQAFGHGERELRWMMRWAAPGATVAIPRQRRKLHVTLPPGLSELGCPSYRIPGAPEIRYLWMAKRDPLVRDTAFVC